MSDAEYRPMIQTSVETIDGKNYSVCLCGWREPHGATRCHNAAHWGNAQRAWEDEIGRVTTRADRERDRADAAQKEVERLRETLKLAKHELDKCTRIKEHEEPGQRWEPVDNVVERIFSVDDVLCKALNPLRG